LLLRTKGLLPGEAKSLVLGRRGVGMVRKLASVVFMLAVLSTVASAVPFSGYRTTDPTDVANFGVVATAGWSHAEGGFVITWQVTDNLNGTWTYRYTITDESGDTPTKGVSHLLIELSDLDVVLTPDTLETSADWSTQPGSSNPGIPGSLLGVKLEWGSTDYVEFTADREPKWGDFYAKDGQEQEPAGKEDVIAYNSGFGTEPTDLTTDFSPWIAVPDTGGGGPQGLIPEPTTIALVGLGIGGLLLKRRGKAA
jgi:hypothetical protein